jgi:UDP-N-acetylmuramate: L-alanyl-gamma-D-glutamyl-meso-diaminopimelate ligase
MASLAGLLKDQGIRVTGSDAAAYPPMSDFLAAKNIPVAQPYAETNLDPRPDLVVVGNAISRGNPELEYVLDNRIPFRSLPQVLYDEFLASRETLVVAGTHGKTTTTSMLAWIFEQAGLRPSFLIGGIAENFGSSYALRESQQFSIEGDEYDTAFFDKGPKFLHYFPAACILTSVEFDHADIYRDLEAVKTAFKRLVNLVPRKGVIVAHDATQNVDECLAKAFCRVERYGLSERAQWQIRALNFEPTRTTWDLWHRSERYGAFEMQLAGEYNVLNATAAIALAAHYGVKADDAAAALVSFKSVKRRLEVKAQVRGITVIDDFAHHPTAIAETLKAVRQRYSGAKLWAVLEPRSNTLRRKIFENELAQSLATADEVVLAGVFKSEAIPEAERLSTSRVIEKLKTLGRPARELADAGAIVMAIAPELKDGDVVCILSNGGFGGIYDKLPKAIEARG